MSSFRGVKVGLHGEYRTRPGAILAIGLLGLALIGCPDRGDDDDSAYADASCEQYCLRMQAPLSEWLETHGCPGAACDEVDWITVYGDESSMATAGYEAICDAAPETPSCRTCTLWFEDALQLRDTLEVVTTCYMHYNDYPEEYDPGECEQACLTAGLEF